MGLFDSLRVFSRLVFFACEMVVNFCVFLLLVINFGSNVLVLVAGLYWLIYRTFVLRLESELRLERFEKLTRGKK